MSIPDIRNYATKINEKRYARETNDSSKLICSTDCNLKYDYQSSDSFRICINDTSLGSPFFPCLKITNQKLSTNPTLQKVPIKFNNVDYYFNEMYLTDSSYNLFTYDNNLKIGDTDTSMCACMIINYDITTKNI